MAQSRNNVSWNRVAVFEDKGPLRISATSSSVDGIRLIEGEDRNVPYVTRSDVCNGISRFVSEKNYEYGCDDAGCITVGLDTQTAFYQPHKFITGQNIQIVDADSLTKDCAIFYVAVLKNQMTAKFNWGGNGATLGRMKRLEAMLPTTKDGNADCQYMADYVRERRKAMLNRYRTYVTAQIAELGDVADIPALNEKKWLPVRLSSIGEISSGRDIYAEERIAGYTPYITSGSQNNGIGYYVRNENDTLDCNYIAFNRNGAVGKAFYHSYKSLMGNDCRKMHLTNHEDNKYVGMFISTAISMQSQCFSYSRKLGTARANQLQVMLPVTNAGEPDYEYMEKYTKNMMLKKYKQYLAFLNAKEHQSQQQDEK